MDKINDKPLVSIILPTYNGEEYIEKALDAIINQTYTNWELIIVNDCSTDSTPEIINKYAAMDNRIKTINNEVNKKVPSSLNIGFSNAKGEYYTWTSDDNYYYPNAIEKMVDFLENNSSYGMVYTAAHVEKDGVLQKDIWSREDTTPERILEICAPGACFLYRASVAKEVGKYNETEFEFNEDYEYWLRMQLVTKIGNIPEPLYLYRLRKGALTYRKQKEVLHGKVNLLRKYRKIYAKHFPEVVNYYKTEYTYDEVLEGKISADTALKTLPKKRFYSTLKREYLYNNNITALKLIPKLGLIYRIKAWKLFIKKQKERFYELNIRRYGDDRGFLTTIENDEIPFKIKRVYYLSDVSKDRAHHAHKRSQRVLSAIQGSVEVNLFDGKNKKSFVLDNPSKAVYFNNRVWCELSNFKDNAIVLALASEAYDESEYIRNYDEFLSCIKENK